MYGGHAPHEREELYIVSGCTRMAVTMGQIETTSIVSVAVVRGSGPLATVTATIVNHLHALSLGATLGIPESETPMQHSGATRR